MKVTKKVGAAVTAWDWRSYRSDGFPLRGRVDRTPNLKSSYLR